MGPGEGIWMAHAYRNHVDERGLARVLQADERELHLLLEEKAAFAHAGWRLRREARVLRCAAARTCECTRGPNRPSSGTTLQSFASPLLSPIRISAREDRHQALASQASSCVPTTAAHVPITSTVTPTVTHCCYARRYAHRCIHCYVHRHAHRYIQRYAHRYTPLLSWRGGRTGRASDGFSRSARKGVRSRPDLKLLVAHGPGLGHASPSALALALALARPWPPPVGASTARHSNAVGYGLPVGPGPPMSTPRTNPRHRARRVSCDQERGPRDRRQPWRGPSFPPRGSPCVWNRMKPHACTDGATRSLAAAMRYDAAHHAE